MTSKISIPFVFKYYSSNNNRVVVKLQGYSVDARRNEAVGNLSEHLAYFDCSWLRYINNRTEIDPLPIYKISK
jgi:hypothetical protein